MRSVATKVAWHYLGTPYIWGGDDFSGFDCSGFVIEILKSVGILPRDGDWTAAMLKSRDIKEGKGFRITLTCLGKGGRVLKQYKSEPVIGTSDWQRVVLEGDIPRGTISLRAGILLQSIGTGWVDDAHLVVN